MDLTGKKIVVFGMGRSGISTLRFLSTRQARVWAVNKGPFLSWQNSEEIKNLVGENYCIAEEDLRLIDIMGSCDLVILSPGIAREHPALTSAHQHKIPIWTEIELAYRFIQNKKIVAVTGSNGKTTVVTMLGEIFKRAGRKVFVGGNIGIPLCEALLAGECFDLYLLELSSFQLESMEEFRPNVAVVLNIYKNHTERYTNIEDYARAKFNIVRRMQHKDLLIVADDQAIISSWAGQQRERVELELIEINNPQKIKDKIWTEYDLAQFQLIGIHNIVNLAFIIAVCKRLQIEQSAVQAVINSFSGVDFRVQKIKSNLACQCFNDAKSTNWNATMTAVNSLSYDSRPLWVIVGGQCRGSSDSIVPHLDFFTSKVAKFILIGDSAKLLASELTGKLDYTLAGNLSGAIDYVEESKFSGNLLFSPAFQSFDQFKNYVDRGNSFNAIIQARK